MPALTIDNRAGVHGDPPITQLTTETQPYSQPTLLDVKIAVGCVGCVGCQKSM
jgi:hypothetical protein